MSELGYPSPDAAAQDTHKPQPAVEPVSARASSAELYDVVKAREINGLVHELSRRTGVQVGIPSVYPVKVGAQITGKDWNVEVLATDWRIGKHPDDCALDVRVRTEYGPDFSLRLQTSEVDEMDDRRVETLVVETLERQSLTASLELYLFEPAE